MSWPLSISCLDNDNKLFPTTDFLFFCFFPSLLILTSLQNSLFFRQHWSKTAIGFDLSTKLSSIPSTWPVWPFTYFSSFIPHVVRQETPNFSRFAQCTLSFPLPVAFRIPFSLLSILFFPTPSSWGNSFPVEQKLFWLGLFSAQLAKGGQMATRLTTAGHSTWGQ